MLVLGRALLATPKVLLLDEMMTGLAPKIVAELRSLVAGLAADGVTVLVAEPALAALKAVVQRGYVMQRGRIVDMRDDAASLDTRTSSRWACWKRQWSSDGDPTFLDHPGRRGR